MICTSLGSISSSSSPPKGTHQARHEHGLKDVLQRWLSVNAIGKVQPAMQAQTEGKCNGIFGYPRKARKYGALKAECVQIKRDRTGFSTIATPVHLLQTMHYLEQRWAKLRVDEQWKDTDLVTGKSNKMSWYIESLHRRTRKYVQCYSML